MFMEIFHLLNRGVDKRSIVQDTADKLRFMQGLYLYNDKNLLNRNTRRYTENTAIQYERDPLVKIYAYCLMNNHYHLLLSPIDNDLVNLSAFMRKLHMGYAKYFNEKYERVGALWQGKSKRIQTSNDAHFNYIPYYIHLNALDYKFKEWRNGEVKNIKEAYNFLSEYRWSSFQDYNAIRNYPSMIDTSLLSPILKTKENQYAEIVSIIQSPTNASYAEIIE